MLRGPRAIDSEFRNGGTALAFQMTRYVTLNKVTSLSDSVSLPGPVRLE